MTGHDQDTVKSALKAGDDIKQHYQIQGTWTTSCGHHVNYLVLKHGLGMNGPPDLANIYLHLESVRACGGLRIDLEDLKDAGDERDSTGGEEDVSRVYVRLIQLVAECPGAVVVQQLFQAFLGSLHPPVSVCVPLPLATPRLLQGRGPRLQLENSLSLDSEGGESEEEENRATKARKTSIKTAADKKKEKAMTADEKRFLRSCRSLGQQCSSSAHFSVRSGSPASQTSQASKSSSSSASLVASCRHCSQDFTGDREEVMAAVVNHVLVQHFQTFAYKCELCGNTFNSQSAFQEHMIGLHKKQIRQFQCPICPELFYSKKDWEGHLCEVHEELDKGLECHECKKIFSSRKTMFAHMRGIHKISSKNVKNDDPVASMCPTCGEKKKSDHNLQQHIKKFHENAYPEPIACQLCSKVKQLRSRKYHTPFSYQLHMKQIHSGEGGDKVVCEYCCKEFVGGIGKVKFALKEHIQAIHMGIRKECDECGKTFISNIVLNKHKKHVHRKEGAYPCKFCGKIFRYSQQAIDHEYKDRGLSPYTCKLCPFKSADNWALAKHKKVCPASVLTVDTSAARPPVPPPPTLVPVATAVL